MKYGKSSQKDIILLLSGLLVLSGGISLLYGDSEANSAVTSVDDKELISVIQPLDASGSVKKMANVIAKSPFMQQVRILDYVLKNQKSVLAPEEKVELGLSLLENRSSAAEQKTLLEMLNKFPGVLKVPLLYIAVEKEQLKAVPMIVQYYKADAATLQKNIYQALIHALKKNDLKAFAQLIITVGGITSQMATDLVWDVLQNKKDAQFIPVLVGQKADLNNAKGGKTPLILAIDGNKVEMVQMLLDNGALPNKFVDAAIGTPLQRAQQVQKNTNGKDSTIELLLRERGAKE